jgi:hypothetical protein
MSSEVQATTQAPSGPDSYRNTARVVGAIYLAGMVVGVGGNILVQSVLTAPGHLATLPANAALVAVGAMLWLLAAAGDAAHGMLMLPVLRRHGERIGFGYFGARIVDAVFVGVMALLILVQIPLGGEYQKAGAAGAASLEALSAVLMQGQLYAYHFGMITVGLAGLMLCYSLYRGRRVPRVLGVWGLVGYATILCGSVLEVLGFDLALTHTIPGGLWELFIGAWLIAKGFSPAATVAAPAVGGRQVAGSPRGAGPSYEWSVG